VVVAVGQRLEAAREVASVGGESGLHRVGLAGVGLLGEGDGLGEKRFVRLGERRFAVGVGQDAHRVVHEGVSAGALHRPVGGEGFLLGEDFFDPDVFDLQLVAERFQVALRVGQAVDVVDAHPIDAFLGTQVGEEAVRVGEDRGVFLAQAGQVVDLKEAAVVEFVQRGAPVREAPVLLFEEVVQGRPPEVLEMRVQVFGLGHVAEARAQVLGGVRVAGRQGAVGVEQVVRAGRFFRQRLVEHVGVAVGAQGEAVLVVGGEEAAVLADEFDRAVVEGLAVGTSQKRQPHRPVGRAAGVPVDVEKLRLGVRAVRERVLPASVLGVDGRVVGHEVEDEAQPGVRGRFAERLEAFAPPQLGAHARQVDRVVPVGGAGRRLGDGREVEVAGAQRLEVRHERFGLGEGKVGRELEAVGGAERGGHAAATGEGGGGAACAAV
jgi:hypothetical protein